MQDEFSGKKHIPPESGGYVQLHIFHPPLSGNSLFHFIDRI